MGAYFGVGDYFGKYGIWNWLFIWHLQRGGDDARRRTISLAYGVKGVVCHIFFATMMIELSFGRYESDLQSSRIVITEKRRLRRASGTARQKILK